MENKITMCAAAIASIPQGRHYDVAVVGYGPVGVTLAGLLGRQGLSVGVFEKSREVYGVPRAVGFDHDAMRIFQRIGVAEALAPHIAPFRDAEYFGIGGRLIQRVKRIPPPYPLTWEPNYTCDQPGVESVLRAAVARFPTVDVEQGHELVRAVEEGGQVWLELRDDAGGESRCSASYLVACDGASSPVRRMLGVELESFDYDEPWIVVDVVVKDEHLAQLPATNVQYCQPERPSTFITCPGNHRRWEFMTLPGEPASGEVSEERLWRLLSRWLKPGEARIWRAAAYQFHALVARDWRRGRVLLAGDSAHMTPPFLGQGMCQGLRDAGNLAWKLARVVRGHAQAALLDTYAEERRPHVVETTRRAKEFGRIISERDPVAAQARDTRMLSAQPGGPRTLYRQELIPGLTTGLVSVVAPLAGQVFPQPLVAGSTGTSVFFDDLTEPGWRLVVADAADAALRHALVALADHHHAQPILLGTQGGAAGRAIGVCEKDGLLARWFAAARCSGALVRPDHYVFGGFDTLANAQDLLGEWASIRALRGG
jgi:3-(3-hydroxy-phenyl)propionate hydroxylase